MEALEESVCQVALEMIMKIGFTVTHGGIQFKGASVELTLRKTQIFQTLS